MYSQETLAPLQHAVNSGTDTLPGIGFLTLTPVFDAHQTFLSHSLSASVRCLVIDVELPSPDHPQPFSVSGWNVSVTSPRQQRYPGCDLI